MLQLFTFPPRKEVSVKNQNPNLMFMKGLTLPEALGKYTFFQVFFCLYICAVSIFGTVLFPFPHSLISVFFIFTTTIHLARW